MMDYVTAASILVFAAVYSMTNRYEMAVGETPAGIAAFVGIVGPVISSGVCRWI